MKRVMFTRMLALCLCAILFVGLVPTKAAEASGFYWAPLVVKATIYHGTDKLKAFETRQAGDKVQVLDRKYYRNNNGETFIRVSAFYNNSSQQQMGYMLSSSIPSGIPATNYVGVSTARNDTYLYTSTSTNGQTMTKIPSGMEIKVVQRFNDWYLAEVQDVFYGYVKASFFSEPSATTTAALAPTTTSTTSTTASGASTGTSGSVRTTVKLLSDEVVTTGSVASGTKLYKINTLSDANAYGQVATKGSCKVLYRVPNNFYMIDVNGLYAYVPTQSVVLNDSSAPMTSYAGTMETIVVSSTNTAIPTTSTAAAATTNTGTIANCNSWVSMRKKASSSSSRLAKVKKGQTVTILGTSGDYTKVSYDGETGYILSSYIK